MGWIGIADQAGGRFDISGLGTSAEPGRPPRNTNSLLPRGTLLLETSLSPDQTPQTLFEFGHNFPRPGRFRLHMLPGGGVELIQEQGHDVRKVALPHDPDSRTNLLRLTYSWDTPRKCGQLTLEYPEIDVALSIRLDLPHPFPLRELRAIVVNPHRRALHPEIDFFAISSRVEPVGPMPGLTGSVQIATPHGPVFADRIRRGDLVTTASGEQTPVLQTVQRTVPARGSFRPVLIRAPYFGLQRDVVVAPQQRLMITGSEVEYMFGKEAVLVPARHLVNGFSTRYAACPDLITYHHVLLPGHDAIMASDCPIESLFIGRLRRKPEQLAASVLAGTDRSRLPEHAQHVCPVLKPFEAVTLAMHRAA